MSAVDSPALYLGLMSGTSADAIDAALVSFDPKPQLHAGLMQPYPQDLRRRILNLAQNHSSITLDELGELDGRIADFFAAAATALLKQAGVAASAVHGLGSHGQTIRHRPQHTVPYTLQLGDPSLIAERTGITTVADFRRRDIAAGGQGAPLVPAFHAALLSSTGVMRVILNLGGIANITVLPGNPLLPVIGCDTGPGNCLLDSWAECQLGSLYDRDGAFAQSGQCNSALLTQLLDDPYFALPAPKSTGRETFNLDWLVDVLHKTQHPLQPADIQATLVELTAQSVARTIQVLAINTTEVLVCGGGIHNPVLIEALQRALAPATLTSTGTWGINPDYMEAMAFAWLARERLEERPGNLPTVTGAKHTCVLGGIYSAR